MNISIFFIWLHRFKSTFQSTQHLIEGLESATALYEEMKNEFPVVICHLDSRIENIIYNSNDGMYFELQMYLILWRYTCMWEKTRRLEDMNPMT